MATLEIRGNVGPVVEYITTEFRPRTPIEVETITADSITVVGTLGSLQHLTHELVLYFYELGLFTKIED